ncbi:MAG: DUF5694 domain-containing protein [Bacteroidota bacterium]
MITTQQSFAQPKDIYHKDDIPKIEIMVVGTYHFANPNQDEFNIDAVDVLTPQKQKEIRSVTESLLKFQPDKVTVEYPRKYQHRLDSLYTAYLNGEHELSRSEREQLGLRLAHEMGHQKIYAVDYKYKFDLDPLKAYAQEHGTNFQEYLQNWGQTLMKKANAIQQNGTVGEALRNSNSPLFEDAQRQMYSKAATVGDDATYPGVELVTNWHHRNLRIFANIEHVAEPGDKIIVFFGSGHSAILRDLIEANPEMTLVDPLDYL